MLKGFSREAIAEAASSVDVGAIVVGLLRSKKERTRLETQAFLRDTIIGRPAQNVQLSGGLVHAHAIWRPLASLTDEEVRYLDAITKKLAAPASNASQMPRKFKQNQTRPSTGQTRKRVHRS